MKLPKNGEHRASTGHHLSPDEASTPGIGLHVVQFLAKRIPCESQTTQAVAKTIDHLP